MTAILRKRLDSRFVQVPNDTARDRRLSFKAVGVLVHILSLPDESPISADYLAEGHTDGRSAVLTALRELTEAGYYRAERRRTEAGTFRMEVTVSNVPMDQPECDYPTPVDPISENPTPNDKDQPLVERPKEENVGDADDGPDSPSALCALLADQIEANGSKRPTVTKAWTDAARLMIERDDRTPEQIRNAITWCQADEFWRANVLSMPTLRRQFDKLRLAAKRGQAKRPVHHVAADAWDRSAPSGPIEL